MESSNTGPSPVVKPYFPEKVKKALWYKLALVGAIFAVLVAPTLARAAFSLSDLLKGTTKSQASGTELNSQTMQILAAAKNINPQPVPSGPGIMVVDGSALQADNNPSGQSSQVEKVESSQISVHVVKEGDTLSGIADLYGVSINTIIWANDIKGRYIYPEQELVILPITGVRHTVAKGETLASIAKKYNGDLEEIASYNELVSDSALALGDVVIIPDGVIAPPPAPRASGSTATRSAGGPPAAAGYYGWPVAGGVKTQGVHGFNGIDIGAAYGTDIFAAADGVVIVARAGGYNGGYGSYVVVQHNNGTQTLYAHASQILVSVGEQVGKGQPIAKMGSTGKSTGNHLHFEVRGASNPFR